VTGHEVAVRLARAFLRRGRPKFALACLKIAARKDGAP
jgi:hypothetical protein